MEKYTITCSFPAPWRSVLAIYSYFKKIKPGGCCLLGVLSGSPTGGVLLGVLVSSAASKGLPSPAASETQLAACRVAEPIPASERHKCSLEARLETLFLNRKKAGLGFLRNLAFEVSDVLRFLQVWDTVVLFEMFS